MTSGSPSERPPHRPVYKNVARVQSHSVNMGETVRLDSQAEFKRHVEASLEQIARHRLLEAEHAANAIIEDARQEAVRILEEVRTEAAGIIEAARGEVNAFREEGFKAGFEEGYADASDRVSCETAEMVLAAQSLIEAACQAEYRILKRFEKDAVEIIRHVARKILGRELAASPETLLAMVDQAVERLHLTGKIRLVVGMESLRFLQEYTPQTQAAMESLKRLELVGDPGLEIGQVYVIGEEGSFDLSMDAQIDQLLAPVEKALTLPRDDGDAAESEASAMAPVDESEPEPSGEEGNGDGHEPA